MNNGTLATQNLITQHLLEVQIETVTRILSSLNPVLCLDHNKRILQLRSNDLIITKRQLTASAMRCFRISWH